MAQLGKAFIEVRADLSKFPAELRAELTKALKEGTAGVSFKELDDKAGEAGKKAANTIGNEMEKQSKTRLKKSGEKAGEDVGLGFFGVLKKLFSGSNSSSGFLSGAGELFKGFTKSAEDGISQLSDGASKISEIGGKVGSAFSAIGSGIQVGMYVLAVPAIGALITVVVQLAGALFALPAGIALVVAAFAPLLIAMHGITDAVGAGFSGDVKKFNEALKGLAPSARSVVREIVALKPAFEAIKNSTQQAFFAPLVGSFKALQGTLLPALNQGLATAAAALGRFVAGFIQLLSQPKIIADITAVFSTLASIIDDIAPVAQEFFGSIFGLIKVGLPFVQKFADYLAVAGQSLVDLLNSAEGTGKIAGFIKTAGDEFGKLITLVGVAGDLFATIFGNADVQKASDDFINSLIEAIGLLDKFFKSAEGKKVLKDFADAIEHAGQIMVVVAAIIIGLLEALHYLNAGIGIAIKAVGAFFQFIGGLAVTVGKAIGDFFATIGGAIADFFTKTIPDAFNAVVSFFEGLPGKVGSGLSSFRETVIHAVESAFTGLVDSVFRNIGRIIGFILAAPFLIQQGLSKLGQLISEAFTSAINFVENAVVTGFNAIVAFFSALPGEVAGFFSSVYHAIVDWISKAIEDAKNFVVNGFNDIIHFFEGLPGKIAALGPKLLHAAEDLGKQIGQGLKNIGNFASDIGKSILNDLKGGLNHIIGSINAGINDVGSSFHIHLPNLPKLARGGIIDSPTVALLGEGSRREVVVPLTDPGRAQQLAQQSGLTRILAAGGGQPTINITAILGTGQILDILDQRVTTALDTQGSELAHGPRS